MNSCAPGWPVSWRRCCSSSCSPPRTETAGKRCSSFCSRTKRCAAISARTGFPRFSVRYSYSHKSHLSGAGGLHPADITKVRIFPKYSREAFPDFLFVTNMSFRIGTYFTDFHGQWAKSSFSEKSTGNNQQETIYEKSMRKQRRPQGGLQAGTGGVLCTARFIPVRSRGSVPIWSPWR